jgi:hypothetical protein
MNICYLALEDRPGTIVLQDSYIHHLHIDGAGDVVIKNCWLGLLSLARSAASSLRIEDSGILNIEVSPPAEGCPIKTAVYFHKLWLPRRVIPEQVALLGPQPWSYMRAHLQSMGNQDATAYFRCAEMALERPQLQPSEKTISRIYQLTSNYGENIGRCFLWIVFVTMLCAILYFYLEGASVTPDCNAMPWARRMCDHDTLGAGLRAAWLALQPFFNPFG